MEENNLFTITKRSTYKLTINSQNLYEYKKPFVKDIKEELELDK